MFHFLNDPAAAIALRTVTQFPQQCPVSGVKRAAFFIAGPPVRQKAGFRRSYPAESGLTVPLNPETDYAPLRTGNAVRTII